ncbi:hypothetical protein PUR61_25830 [Streptomyces sp. BE20]|uniref:VMAP-C domain-containing protein n=1 Tax=Streptomyces sp. BE20 TaxID=3002525 RepID=UPI002E77063B|nr:hypothetical protein [Streptomyces sp. BE20]MEE1825580.1 hypothetical protein [Streptomyces sp. BE20]
MSGAPRGDLTACAGSAGGTPGPAGTPVGAASGGAVPAGTWPVLPEEPAPGTPWSVEAEELLVDILLSVDRMARLSFRQDVLDRMGRSAKSRGIHTEVCETNQARSHVRHLLHAIGTSRDRAAALESVGDALRGMAPQDGALPWLELTTLVLAPDSPLPADAMPAVIGELRRLPALPGLHDHLPRDTTGLTLLTGRETLPEILVRLVNRRGPAAPDVGPFLEFLRALGSDPAVAGSGGLTALRGLLDRLGGPRHAAGPDEPDRLIVQIRLDEETPEHIDNGRYRLFASYYRQPVAGGPFRRIGDLGATQTVTRNELVEAGSARLTSWPALARELRLAAGSAVRIEFLLPRSLLGHSAELWSPGATRRPLGRNHPVVVRSLERYADSWLDVGPWRTRWSHLNTRATDADGLDLIGWPPLDAAQAGELPDWLSRRPELSCMGLDTPYEELDPEVRRAVDDAIYLDGMPVLLWRRVAGDPAALVKALREHGPGPLAELPDTVHRYRRRTRAAEADPHDAVTLLWDDPDCVDPEQDSLYPGMV